MPSSSRIGLTLLRSSPARWLADGYRDFLARRCVRRAARRSPYYRERLRGIDVRRVRGVRDLSRLPVLTTVDDLIRDRAVFLAVPDSRVAGTRESSGTSGAKKRAAFTQRDLDRSTRRIRWAHRISREEGAILQILTSSESEGAAWMSIKEGIATTGRTVIEGDTGDPDRFVDQIRTNGVTRILARPAGMERITRLAEARTDLRELGVAAIHLTAEAFSEGLRTYLEEIWAARVVDSYAIAEVGLIGTEIGGSRTLVVLPSMFVEILDPESDEPLPEGERGEIVVTTLENEGMPLLRYRTGDISRLIPGFRGWRLDRVAGRVDEMVSVGDGRNLRPGCLEDAVRAIPGVGTIQLLLTREGFRDVLTFRIEAAVYETLESRVTEAILDAFPGLRRDLARGELVAPFRFEFAAPGTLAGLQTSAKFRRVIDERPPR